ncbi:methyl-accepting chemotaxis protein [Luteolibacter yonseiensis]|uniref:Methyl-accepting chemotaxis protein n=1 Tax=Luteolibacter yonseiensis TaxID=1144680 RepID=A0A934R6Z7_9BACT|nr:methyl-accepting chemotaxis protein [Luteolibacter yonseiensis]MBK1817366.1 methyl-accepting chemotaxis protein [Luteolibacter yonseiensis]
MHVENHIPLHTTADNTGTLHSKVSRWTLAATVIGMAIYSLVEYFIEPPSALGAFLLHHVLHVAVIGFAVWVVSFLLIRRLLIEPTDHIFLHLRRVAAGRLEFLDCTVSVKEVGHVVASVNHLVTRLRRTPEPDSVSRSLDHLRGLREALKTVSATAQDDLVPVMRLVTALEGDLLDLLQVNEDEVLRKAKK